MTAEEFITKKGGYIYLGGSAQEFIELQMFMIEFAQFHVKQALLEASYKAQAKENPSDYGTGEIWVDTNSILNAYPDDRIR